METGLEIRRVVLKILPNVLKQSGRKVAGFVANVLALADTAKTTCTVSNMQSVILLQTKKGKW